MRYFTLPTHKIDHYPSMDLYAPDTALLRLTIQHPGDSATLFILLSTFTSAREDTQGAKIHSRASWGPESIRICEGPGALVVTGLVRPRT